MKRARLNCRACKNSYMEPDSPLICATVGSAFGTSIYGESPPPCGPGHRLFAQHPMRKPDGNLRSGPADMPTSPAIVCLCGSGRFATDFARVAAEQTLRGNIVVAPGVFGKQDLTPAQAQALDDLHLRKIDLATFVLVLNIDGYIGQSTANEIRYALAADKPIQFHDPEHGEAWIKENCK